MWGIEMGGHNGTVEDASCIKVVQDFVSVQKYVQTCSTWFGRVITLFDYIWFHYNTVFVRSSGQIL